MNDKTKMGSKATAQTKPGDKSTPAAPQGTKPEAGQKPSLAQKPAAGFSVELLMATYGKKRSMLQKVHDGLKGRLTRYQAAIEKLQGEVSKITEKLGTVIVPSFLDVFCRPIAAELSKLFPPKTLVDIVGPVGVMESVTITFSEPDASADDRMTGRKSKSITLIPYQGGIGVRDYSKDTKEFAPGTLGYASGGNHPTIKAPNNADAKWFAAMVK